MKKTILLCSLLALLSSYSFSQVGVKTEYPQGIFHVDGAGNNGTTVPPTAVTDDVLVDTSGNIGIGTISPTAKIDIVATGGEGIRMNDGAVEKGKIIVSDASGNMSWGTRPSPGQVEGSIISISTSASATSTSAPNLKGTIPAMTGNASGAAAVKISNTSLSLTEGTWLIQLKYTTRTTNGTSTYGTGCGNGFDFYIWTLLYDETNSAILTTVGTSQEKQGYCISTPQVNHIVKVATGATMTVSAYASTSTTNNVIVYVNNDISGFSFGTPFFKAVRLDSFN